MFSAPAIHSNGKAARRSLFAFLSSEPEALALSVFLAPSFALLTSVPNRRPEPVNARGRPMTLSALVDGSGSCNV